MYTSVLLWRNNKYVSLCCSLSCSTSRAVCFQIIHQKEKKAKAGCCPIITRKLLSVGLNVKAENYIILIRKCTVLISEHYTVKLLWKKKESYKTMPRIQIHADILLDSTVIL